MRLRRMLLVSLVLVATRGAAEVQICTILPDDSLVCPPLRTPLASVPPRAMVIGQVTAVLDNDTLQVEGSGGRLLVHLHRGSEEVTSAELAAVALQRTVAVYIRETDRDGSVFADVLVDNRENLLTLLPRRPKTPRPILQQREQAR